MGCSGKRVPWSREERSRVSGEPRELRCRSAVRPKGYPAPGVPGCPESRLTGQPGLGAGRSPLRDARRSSRGSQGAAGAAAPRRGQLRVSAAGRCRPARTPPDPPGERRSRPAPPGVVGGWGGGETSRRGRVEPEGDRDGWLISTPPPPARSAPRCRAWSKPTGDLYAHRCSISYFFLGFGGKGPDLAPLELSLAPSLQELASPEARR